MQAHFYTCLDLSWTLEQTSITVWRLGPPSPPENLEVLANRSSDISVSWRAGFHGGYPPQTFIVTAQDTETGEAYEVMVQQDGETEGKQLTATITGLEADTQYRISVRAKNNRPKAKGKNVSEYNCIAARTASMLYCFPSVIVMPMQFL